VNEEREEEGEEEEDVFKEANSVRKRVGPGEERTRWKVIPELNVGLCKVCTFKLSSRHYLISPYFTCGNSAM
jgi:hypothetical protein